MITDTVPVLIIAAGILVAAGLAGLKAIWQLRN